MVRTEAVGRLVQERCPLWARDGECHKNPGWMQTNCREACRVCAPAPAPQVRSSACTACTSRHG